MSLLLGDLRTLIVELPERVPPAPSPLYDAIHRTDTTEPAAADRDAVASIPSRARGLRGT